MSHDVYLRYSEAAVVRTTSVVTMTGTQDHIHIDLDAEGNVVGVELLDVATIEIDGRLAR